MCVCVCVWVRAHVRVCDIDYEKIHKPILLLAK